MKFKSVSLACFIAAALIVSASLHSAHAENRYAIEGVLGKTYQQNAVVGLPTLSGHGQSQGIRGIVFIARHLAFEATYMDFGRGEDSYVDEFGDTITNGLDTNSVNLGLQGELPLNGVVALIGRFGISMWEFNFTETDSAFPGDVYRDDDEGTDIYIGIGMQMKLENNLRLSVEYHEMEISPAVGAVDTDHTLSGVSLSAGISF